MALFKAVVWALIFLTKLRFPPGVSIAIVLKCHCKCHVQVHGVQVFNKGSKSGIFKHPVACIFCLLYKNYSLFMSNIKYPQAIMIYNWL